MLKLEGEKEEEIGVLEEEKTIILEQEVLKILLVF
jgi:hypothetical protein|tara:strand:- start:65 stop:169 length:105 start_codon:yes stop_codon:yes gene_type:complete